MIPANVKDLIDTIASVGTVVGFIMAGILWYITRLDSREKGLTAIGQINTLATNHIPHLQTELETLNTQVKESNKTLSDIATGIAILVDRPRT